jgi:ATP-dependent Zn protease
MQRRRSGRVHEKKRRRIEIAAYHEAGHAVMAVLTRTPLHDTTIVASRLGASSGATRLQRSHVNGRLAAKAKPASPGHRQILRRACFDIAGEIAERRFAPSSWRTLHSRSDLTNVSRLLDTLGLSEKRLNALVKAIVIKADSLIAANWSRVEAVASELLKRGTLTGAQVRAIVAGIRGGAEGGT